MLAVAVFAALQGVAIRVPNTTTEVLNPDPSLVEPPFFCSTQVYCCGA